MSRVALIAGGAGGLGRALAAGLIKQGFHVVVLDLPTPELTAMSDCETYSCDMTDAGALAGACAGIVSKYPAIDLVVYAQGITCLAEFEKDTDAAHRKVFEVNYFASVSLARHMLKPVRAAEGTHLALSSVAGFAPLVRRTAYAASKHALEGFFKSLRSEERAFNVRVLIAAPSFVATNTGASQPTESSPSHITRPGAATDGIDYMSPKTAAEIILKGYAKGHDTLPVGRVSRLAGWLVRLWPALYERQMLKQMNKP